MSKDLEATIDRLRASLEEAERGLAEARRDTERLRALEELLTAKRIEVDANDDVFQRSVVWVVAADGGDSDGFDSFTKVADEALAADSARGAPHE